MTEKRKGSRPMKTTTDVATSILMILPILMGAMLLPETAVAVQQTTVTTSTVTQPNVPTGGSVVTQTTVTTSTVTQTNVPTGGSVFNPFPLLGAAVPLATSPTNFNPSPLVGNAPPTPATGISV